VVREEEVGTKTRAPPADCSGKIHTYLYPTVSAAQERNFHAPMESRWAREREREEKITVTWPKSSHSTRAGRLGHLCRNRSEFASPSHFQKNLSSSTINRKQLPDSFASLPPPCNSQSIFLLKFSRIRTRILFYCSSVRQRRDFSTFLTVPAIVYKFVIVFICGWRLKTSLLPVTDIWLSGFYFLVCFFLHQNQRQHVAILISRFPTDVSFLFLYLEVLWIFFSRYLKCSAKRVLSYFPSRGETSGGTRNFFF